MRTVNNTWPRRGLPPRQRFYMSFKVWENGCWNWISGVNHRGYGNFWWDTTSKTISAHRASWLLHHGDIEEGKLVCHHCDNKICVNPQHLFLDTWKGNLDDMRRKGRDRYLSGESHPMAKLTAQKALDIFKS